MAHLTNDDLARIERRAVARGDTLKADLAGSALDTLDQIAPRYDLYAQIQDTADWLNDALADDELDKATDLAEKLCRLARQL